MFVLISGTFLEQTLNMRLNHRMEGAPLFLFLFFFLFVFLVVVVVVVVVLVLIFYFKQ